MVMLCGAEPGRAGNSGSFGGLGPRSSGGMRGAPRGHPFEEDFPGLRTGDGRVKHDQVNVITPFIPPFPHTTNDTIQSS